MILAIFLVGAFIFFIACKAENIQRKKEMDEMKRVNKMIKKMINSGDLNKK